MYFPIDLICLECDTIHRDIYEFELIRGIAGRRYDCSCGNRIYERHFKNHIAPPAEPAPEEPEQEITTGIEHILRVGQRVDSCHLRDFGYLHSGFIEAVGPDWVIVRHENYDKPIFVEQENFGDLKN